MARKRNERCQQHGSAWHWKQTDCWYFTPSGTKKRQAQFDEDGKRIRGKDNKKAAQLALARIKLSDELTPAHSTESKDWTVAQVCEIYLSDLTNTASPVWVTSYKSWLNDFCEYCRALTVHELKKKHLRTGRSTTSPSPALVAIATENQIVTPDGSLSGKDGLNFTSYSTPLGYKTRSQNVPKPKASPDRSWHPTPSPSDPRLPTPAVSRPG